jgi:putative transposase
MVQKYDPEIHHRRSIRLPDYDYAQDGWYYVTICSQNHRCLFGEISQEKMILNSAGAMIEKWWRKLPEKYPGIQLDEYVVMPNHLHGIIVIVGAAPRGRPNTGTHSVNESGQPHRVAPTLGVIIGWFKTMSTNEYIRNVKQDGWPAFEKRVWQRNYYEHIIRKEKELHSIQNYIAENPMRWEEDENHPNNIRAAT